MHRIDCPTATPDNRFTEGDPTIPVAATTVTANWLNAVQEELAAVIASAELSLDKEDNAQLLQALHKILDLRAPLATLLKAGLVQPDGATTTVDEDGLLSALGGNLLLDSELRITESGTFEAPVAGWYEILLIGGGNGVLVWNGQDKRPWSGRSGGYRRIYKWLEKGSEHQIVIGAGGTGMVAPSTTDMSLVAGGETSFDDDTSDGAGVFYFPSHGPLTQGYVSGSNNTQLAFVLYGGGLKGNFPAGGSSASGLDGSWYGAGGTGISGNSGSSDLRAGNGYQGAVIMRYHDPAKATGPQPEPALFSARRMARAVAEPAAVNLYDPETGQGSVWNQDDVAARLAEGLITEDAWTEICAARAAEDYAAWLADPATSAGRFELLRQARDARLAATDYLVAPDYPLSEDQRAQVTAYRQALRDLPAQAGAPWDGGGEATPWPEAPAVAEVQEV